MASTKIPPTFAKITSRMHVTLYKMSSGRIGASIGGAQTLILGTTGRVSGQKRQTPLFGVERPNGWAVAASNSGHDKAPDWYYTSWPIPLQRSTRRGR